jgi:hypothetical protein
MDCVDHSLRSKYVIRNYDNSEFLYSEDKMNKTIVKSRSSMDATSVCIFEKRNEGYLIKNNKFGEYLFIDEETYLGNRIAKWSTNIYSNSYFNLMKQNNGNFIIRSQKYSDYLHPTKCYAFRSGSVDMTGIFSAIIPADIRLNIAYISEDVDKGTNILSANRQIFPSSYFTFEIAPNYL